MRRSSRWDEGSRASASLRLNDPAAVDDTRAWLPIHLERLDRWRSLPLGSRADARAQGTADRPGARSDSHSR